MSHTKYPYAVLDLHVLRNTRRHVSAAAVPTKHPTEKSNVSFMSIHRHAILCALALERFQALGICSPALQK